MTEKTNRAVSVYDEMLCFCKNTQATLTCRVETFVCLILFSGHLSEVRLNNFLSLFTRRVIS